MKRQISIIFVSLTLVFITMMIFSCKSKIFNEVTENNKEQRKIITDTLFTVIRSDNHFDWVNKLDLSYGNNNDVISATFPQELYQKLKINPTNFTIRIKQYDTLTTPYEYHIIDKNTDNSYKIQDANDLSETELTQIIDFWFVRSSGIWDEYLGDYKEVMNCISCEFIDLNSDNSMELIIWANSPCFVNNRGSQFYIFRKIQNVWVLIFETSAVIHYEILNHKTKDFYNLFTSGMSGNDEVRLYYKYDGRNYEKYSMSVIPFEDN